MAGSAWALPELSANADEGLYLLQADALVDGRLAPVAPHDDPAAHLPWFSVVRDDSYVLKYAPVHASVLAAAEVVAGSSRAALGLVAAAQVVLVAAFARELGASRRAALVAAAVFACAPVVLLLDLTFLPYSTSLALLLAAGTAALRAVRTGSRSAAGLAGLCWGLAAFARPYDAALFLLAIGVAVFVRVRGVDRARARQLAGLGGCAALGVAGPLVALLAFNRAMTGSAFELPFQLLEPRDGPGLGLRRALPSDSYVDYTLGRALSSLGRNLLLVVVWAGGGLIGCLLAVSAIVRRRLQGWLVVLAVLVVWPIGYALFWGSYVASFLWDGALFLGPYYYLPMVAVLAVATGVGLEDLWRWRPGVAVAAALGAVALAGAVAVPRVAEQRDRSQPRVAVADAVADGIDGPALVFVPALYGPYLQNPLSFLRNDASLDGPVIYALDRGEAANERIRAAHPDRRAYRLVLPVGWSDRPGFDPQVSLEPLG